MTTFEIIDLGLGLGLSFNIKYNLRYKLAQNIVVMHSPFNQRFTIDGSLTNKEIYQVFGESVAAISKKRRALKNKKKE